MIHINQRGELDCGIACLAMLTGRSYEYVESEGLSLPLTFESAICYLKNNGLPKSFMAAGYGYSGVDKCMAAVPSLNVQGGMHWIVIDKNHIVYDPQKNIQGKKYYEDMGIKGIGAFIIVDTDVLDYHMSMLKKLFGK